MNKIATAVLSLGIFLVQGAAVHAGHPVVVADTGKNEVVIEESPFDKGNFEFQVLAGAFFSFNHSPDFDYALATIRGGWMLYSPSGSGICRGNLEFLIEVFGGPIFEGPGNGLVGGSLLLRYNFVQPDATVVPYFQIGAGGLYSDAAKDQNQRLIGSDFEFTLHATLGLRWFCTPNCAFTIEGSYRHISNADTADRNVGVDALGGMLGVSIFF